MLFFIWIILNTGPLANTPIGGWDAFPYGLLTMCVSLEAIILSVFVLLSQNRQVARDRVRNDIEYEVNVKSELEIAHLHEKFDHLHVELLERLSTLEKHSRGSRAQLTALTALDLPRQHNRVILFAHATRSAQLVQAHPRGKCGGGVGPVRAYHSGMFSSRSSSSPTTTARPRVAPGSMTPPSNDNVVESSQSSSSDSTAGAHGHVRPAEPHWESVIDSATD